MAKKYLGKLEYVCKIVTPDFKTAREILSDERIEPQVGDVVYVDGIDHIVSKVSCEYDFDKYIRTHIVYLDEIAGGRLEVDTIEAMRKHIEALQAENEQLQAQVARMRDIKCRYEDLCQKLRAQVARLREALTVANNYMPDIGQFCACGKCKKCETDINYAGYGYCLKCARNIIDTALSDTPADYHLKAELARYKLEAEKIPNICYKYRYDPDECVPNDECPQICSKWKNKDESIK